MRKRSISSLYLIMNNKKFIFAATSLICVKKQKERIPYNDVHPLLAFIIYSWDDCIIIVKCKLS